VRPVKFLAAALILLAALGQSGCAAPERPQPPSKPQVVASIYPVYYFASRIGGDKIDLVQLVPAGAEPHSWEPTPQDLQSLEQAQLFLYSGAGMEGWVADLAEVLEQQQTKVLDVSHNLELMEAEEGHTHGGQPDHEESPSKEGHHEEEGSHQYDPHVWMDPVMAGEMARNIAQALREIDRAHGEDYQANLAALEQELEQLDRTMTAELARCRQRKFIVTHAAFGYLAQRYGLEQLPVMGIDAGTEPTPTRLAQLADLARRNNIHTIFLEELVSPRTAQTLAAEINAQTDVLHPIGSLTPEEQEKGEDYFSLMYRNLEKLKGALDYVSGND
jgi:zinc transport system substrate-binding protein